MMNALVLLLQRWDLHYQPFGYYGNDTSLGPADWYNTTLRAASDFTVLKGGRNLLRSDVVFWGWYIGEHHMLASRWEERWRIVHAYIQPWIANGSLSGIYFGDELMGQGLPLSNLSAAVKLVRATWPNAVLAYNEDFCTMVTGFNQQAERVSADPDWRLPSELNYFSIDWCKTHVLSRVACVRVANQCSHFRLRLSRVPASTSRAGADSDEQLLRSELRCGLATRPRAADLPAPWAAHQGHACGGRMGTRGRRPLAAVPGVDGGSAVPKSTQRFARCL